MRATHEHEKSAHKFVSEDNFAERASNIVLAKNMSSGDLPRYSVVKFSGVQTDPALSASAANSFLERPILSVDFPGQNATSWGITVDPIKQYTIGRIAIGGAVPVKIDIKDADHVFARPVAGVHGNLQSSHPCAGSCGILWKESGTGLKWALVRVGSGGSGVLLGKTSAQWAKGSLATISLYEEGAPPSESQNAPAATLEGCINKFANVSADKWVIVAQSSRGHWYLVSAEC